MTDAEQQQLIDDHFLFDKPVSPLLLASGMARDWPDARGIWWVYAQQGELCEIPATKSLEILVVADIIGQNSTLWTYAAESNEELLRGIPWGSDIWKQNLPQVLVCTALGW